jgi:hypothetical protein
VLLSRTSAPFQRGRGAPDVAGRELPKRDSTFMTDIDQSTQVQTLRYASWWDHGDSALTPYAAAEHRAFFQETRTAAISAAQGIGIDICPQPWGSKDSFHGQF